MRLKRPLSNAEGRGKAAWVWSGGRGGGVGEGGRGGGGGGDAEAGLNVCRESCEESEVEGLGGCFKLRGCAASTVYFVSVFI